MQIQVMEKLTVTDPRLLVQNVNAQMITLMPVILCENRLRMKQLTKCLWEPQTMIMSLPLMVIYLDKNFDLNCA